MVFALQLPEVDEELLLNGEGAVLEKLATMGVLATALGVELGMAIVEVAVEGYAPPQGPHWPGVGWLREQL